MQRIYFDIFLADSLFIYFLSLLRKSPSKILLYEFLESYLLLVILIGTAEDALEIMGI